MSEMIQTLERRMMLSASAADLAADVADVKSDVKAVVAAHDARYDTSKADYNSLVASLRALDEGASRAVKALSVRQATVLAASNTVSHARIVADINALDAYATSESVLGAAAGKTLLLHPTSVAAQKAVARLITNLNTNVAPKITKLQNELTAAEQVLTTDADAIATSNPSLSSVISSELSTLATETATLSSAAGTVATGTAKLASDLASIPT